MRAPSLPPALRRLIRARLTRARALLRPSGGPPDADPAEASAPAEGDVLRVAARLDETARRRLGRSLALFHVGGGGCGGCELELRMLRSAVYDLERFGLSFVASPRHADVLVVTGPPTRNMREALERARAAMPDPGWVVAVGDCALGAGPFAGGYAVHGGVAEAVPVDLAIPGCPPAPARVLAGLRVLLEANAR